MQGVVSEWVVVGFAKLFEVGEEACGGGGEVNIGEVDTDISFGDVCVVVCVVVYVVVCVASS